MRKNILICLEKLGIGGVETAVINQAIELKQKGLNVFVMAEKGDYSETLEKNGVICIECKFELEDRFDNDKIKNIINILKQYDIGQVHIHQFPCILQLWYACALLKIPYVTYIHSGTKQIYEWYETTYNIYVGLLKVFFKNAHKIVAVSNAGRDSNKEYYDFSEEKYLVLNNSINFDQYKNEKEVHEIKNFLILTRIATEKMVSIKNAIELFVKYQEDTNNSEIVLNIYGGGPKEDELKDYIAKINVDKKYNINLCGATSNVKEVIEEHDVVIAIGRCILEAMAMKRIAIISGNSGDEPLKFIVKENNIEEAIEQNFSGTVLKKENIEDIIKELKNLDLQKIKNIVDKNYNVIYEKLNIQNNVYYITDDEDDNTDYENILYSIFEKQNNQIDINQKEENNAVEDNRKLQEKIKSYAKDIKNLETQRNELVQENDMLKSQINNIYNSKRWKYMNKIARIFNK